MRHQLLPAERSALRVAGASLCRHDRLPTTWTRPATTAGLSASTSPARP